MSMPFDWNGQYNGIYIRVTIVR